MNLAAIVRSQEPLFDALDRAAAGELTVDQTKPFGAPFGVYPQRDGSIMARVRIPGGEATVEELAFLARLTAKTGASFAHPTTRQDIQLHGLAPAGAAAVVRQCTAGGLPFRGGGGDTFRNIAISPGSGFAPGSLFDLAPYARALTRLMFDWETAFKLPRKLKIAFASADDEALALRQDLGFVEALDAGGRRGFTVYGGGGFGKQPALGVKLFDFLDAADAARAARAMVDLFFEHGNRENRGEARVRYILKKIGEPAFRELFLSCFDRLDRRDVPPLPRRRPDWSYAARPAMRFPADVSLDADPAYTAWRAVAVRPTRLSPRRVSVTLFVPRGTLTAKEFAATVRLLRNFAVPAVRLTPEQNILIPALSTSALPALYRALTKLPFELAFRRFAGQLECCIGSTVCKIGVLDAPKYGLAVARALDDWFDARPDRRAELAPKLLAALHFSGCPNSCTSHQAVRFGFHGCRKNIDGEIRDCFVLWRRDPADPNTLGVAQEEIIPADRLPARVLELLAEAGLLA
jgi:sulfite reductase beta subunit-like hemoprotein